MIRPDIQPGYALSQIVACVAPYGYELEVGGRVAITG